MTDDDMIERVKRDAFGDKADLANSKVVGSGISETARISVKALDAPELLADMPQPWAENREMIKSLFTPFFDRSFHCPGRDRPQCCQSADRQNCVPQWREREDPEWYAREIDTYLTLVTDRLGQASHVTTALAADEAFELGCLFTEALIKFRWDQDAKRGEKSAEGSKLGGQMRRGSNRSRLSAEETVTEVDELLLQGNRKKAAYAMIAEQQNVSSQTISKEYQRAKKER